MSRFPYKLQENGSGSRILQKVTIYIAKQDYCKEMYRKLLYNIYNTHICANDPNIKRGSCKVNAANVSQSFSFLI